MNNKQLYEIRLEDYSFPRYASKVKSYFGARDDIDKLIAYLKDDDNLRVRYSETIEAAETYDGTNVPIHNVAGQMFPILISVQEVCRFETQLADQSWTHMTHDGQSYPCKAATVDICQNLIRTETGYERCFKARVSGLCVCFQGPGWARINNSIWGFPGVITWDDGDHTLNLFVSQAHYDFSELDAATADVGNVQKIDLSVISADILGEG